MSSRAILDSSPAGGIGMNIPPPARPLKRSASEMSLPSPPQTVKSRKRHAKSRSRSRGSSHAHHSDSDDIQPSDVGDTDTTCVRTHPRRVLFAPRKKQRTDRLDAVVIALSGADNDNPFWDGPSTTMQQSPRSAAPPATDIEDNEEERQHSESPDDLPIDFHTTQVLAPVSPPPSRRQTRVKSRVAPLPPAPTTPKANNACSSTTRKKRPVRDSPNNPFLDDSPESVSGGPIEPRTPTPQEHVEKPTISYVFRGVKTTFANPLYGLSPSVRARAMLPLEHPDYEPDPACPPKVLFPGRHRRAQSPTQAVAGRSLDNPGTKGSSSEEWDSDDETLALSPPKRLFQG